jgi:hypothetical protein
LDHLPSARIAFRAVAVPELSALLDFFERLWRFRRLRLTEIKRVLFRLAKPFIKRKHKLFIVHVPFLSSKNAHYYYSGRFFLLLWFEVINQAS